MPSISYLFTGLFDKKDESDPDELPIRDIMATLHELGFGVIILMFALPAMVPGLPPPIHTLVSIPLCFVGWQMMRGYDSIRLPHFIGKRMIKRSSLQKAITVSLPHIRRAERFTKARLSYIDSKAGERLMGLMILLFALTVAVPAPLTNTVPGFAIAIIGVAILEKDGLLGIIGSVIGLVWMTMLIFLSKEMIAFVYSFF
jgi:hypothetical protein